MPRCAGTDPARWFGDDDGDVPWVPFRTLSLDPPDLVAGVAGCAGGPTPRSERRVRNMTNAAKGALTTVTAANAPFAASLMERTRLSLHPFPRTRAEHRAPGARETGLPRPYLAHDKNGRQDHRRIEAQRPEGHPWDIGDVSNAPLAAPRTPQRQLSCRERRFRGINPCPERTVRDAQRPVWPFRDMATSRKGLSRHRTLRVRAGRCAPGARETDTANPFPPRGDDNTKIIGGPRLNVSKGVLQDMSRSGHSHYVILRMSPV